MRLRGKKSPMKIHIQYQVDTKTGKRQRDDIVYDRYKNLFLTYQSYSCWAFGFKRQLFYSLPWRKTKLKYHINFIFKCAPSQLLRLIRRSSALCSKCGNNLNTDLYTIVQLKAQKKGAIAKNMSLSNLLPFIPTVGFAHVSCTVKITFSTKKLNSGGCTRKYMVHSWLFPSLVRRFSFFAVLPYSIPSSNILPARATAAYYSRSLVCEWEQIFRSYPNQCSTKGEYKADLLCPQ